jgi:hypothetical protein
MTYHLFYELIPAVALERLKDNFLKNLIKERAGEAPIDFQPVVKLWLPTGRMVWLVTEYDEKTDCLWGLCDFGIGHPEFGYVCLDELKNLAGPCGVKTDRDASFFATKTLSEYAEDARCRGYIET